MQKVKRINFKTCKIYRLSIHHKSVTEYPSLHSKPVIKHVIDFVKCPYNMFFVMKIYDFVTEISVTNSRDFVECPCKKNSLIERMDQYKVKIHLMTANTFNRKI